MKQKTVVTINFILLFVGILILTFIFNTRMEKMNNRLKGINKDLINMTTQIKKDTSKQLDGIIE